MKGALILIHISFVSVEPGAPRGAGSEDCLHVNIYAPYAFLPVLSDPLSQPKSTSGAPPSSRATQIPSSPAPVMVYFHGGGFTYGNPASWPFDEWVEQSPDIIVVSVYYRLGVLGFMSAPRMGNGRGGDLNAGLWDQLEALRWVQKVRSRCMVLILFNGILRMLTNA